MSAVAGSFRRAISPSPEGRVNVPLRGPVLHGAVLVAVCLAAYSNSFRVPFLFDDVPNILENPYVRDLGSFFASGGSRPYVAESGFVMRRVGYLTLALNFGLGGVHVAGYHAVNLLIHCINALLVYRLVALSFRTPALAHAALRGSASAVALFSSLLFASHPVQTQAVTYIVQRFASLATLFYLLSLTAYIKARLGPIEDGPSWKAKAWYGCSLASAVVAMHTKEIAFTLPLAVALYEGMFFEGRPGKRIALVAPFLATMAIIPLNLLALRKGTGPIAGIVDSATRVGSDVSRPDYFITQLRVIVTYLRLLFFPANQNLDYDYPVYRSVFDGEILASAALLLGLAGFAAWLLRRDRARATGAALMSFGIFWFFLALSVESGVIPITEVINEHRLYLPSAGFFISLAGMCFLVAHRTGKDAARRGAIVVLACAVVLFTGLTVARNGVWQSGLSLWSDVVKKSPGNARGHANLGVELRASGRPREAIDHYLTAIRLKPDYVEAYNGLGNAYKDAGLIDNAIAQYETAIRLQADFAESYNNLGVVYWQKGMIPEAMQYYLKAVSLDFGFAQAHTNLGVVYWQQGMKDQAAEQYRIAIALRPDIADPYNNLGVLYASAGHPDLALEYFERAVRIRPDRADFRQNRDKAYETRIRR